jgi:hypothetical protein
LRRIYRGRKTMTKRKRKGEWREVTTKPDETVIFGLVIGAAILLMILIVIFGGWHE